MKSILTFLLLSICLVSFGQEGKKKVLVVLYDQVDLSTQFTLSELGKTNLVPPSVVYDSLISVFMNAFIAYNGDRVTYESLAHGENTFIKSNTSKSNVKKPSRFGISLSRISNVEFNYLLTKNEADYIVFVNFYQFKKRRIPDDEKEGLRLNLIKRNIPFDIDRKLYYSEHLIDFELFGKNKELLYANGRFEIAVPPISHKNFLLEGKDFATVRIGYDRFVAWFAKELMVITK
jgi:hypothetical protein